MYKEKKKRAYNGYKVFRTGSDMKNQIENSVIRRV